MSKTKTEVRRQAPFGLCPLQYQKGIVIFHKRYILQVLIRGTCKFWLAKTC